MEVCQNLAWFTSEGKRILWNWFLSPLYCSNYLPKGSGFDKCLGAESFKSELAKISELRIQKMGYY